jgi:hypothetical protein
MYTLVCKCKNDSCWNCSRSQGRVDEREVKGEGWSQVWYIWYFVRTFVNATMYPHQAQQWKIKQQLEKKRNKTTAFLIFKKKGWFHQWLTSISSGSFLSCQYAQSSCLLSISLIHMYILDLFYYFYQNLALFWQ